MCLFRAQSWQDANQKDTQMGAEGVSSEVESGATDRDAYVSSLPALRWDGSWLCGLAAVAVVTEPPVPPFSLDDSSQVQELPHFWTPGVSTG